MNLWADDPQYRSLRDLLLEAWRLTAFAIHLVDPEWKLVRSNHDYIYGQECCRLLSVPQERFPCGDVSDAEVDLWVRIHGTWGEKPSPFCAASRVKDLPDIGDDLSKRSIGRAVGFAKDSKIVDHLYRAVSLCVEEGRPHRGEVMRLCFACDRRQP